MMSNNLEDRVKSLEKALEKAESYIDYLCVAYKRLESRGDHLEGDDALIQDRLERIESILCLQKKEMVYIPLVATHE